MNATHRIHEVRDEGGKLSGYRVGTRRALVPHGYPIYGWLHELSEDVRPLHQMSVDDKFVRVHKLIDIPNGDESQASPAGVYIIFTEGQDHDKVVRYVGQSVVLDTRLKRHREGIEVSRALIAGNLSPDVPWPVPTMYKRLQELVNDYGMTVHFERFEIPYVVYNDCYRYDGKCRPRLRPGSTLGEVLTILEQWLMDIFRPELNEIPARKTK